MVWSQSEPPAPTAPDIPSRGLPSYAQLPRWASAAESFLCCGSGELSHFSSRIIYSIQKLCHYDGRMRNLITAASSARSAGSNAMRLALVVNHATKSTFHAHSTVIIQTMYLLGASLPPSLPQNCNWETEVQLSCP